MIEGHNFVDRMSAPELVFPFEHNEPSRRDYIPGVMHIRRILNDVEDRKQRSNQLSDVRRLKLHQLIQLYTSERDADQVICFLMYFKSHSKMFMV